MANNSHSEVEIKFLVADAGQLEATLREIGFRLQTPLTHEYNTIYDRPTGEFRKQGELLRLRRYGDQWTLTHKGRSFDARHKTRTETETQVSDGQALDSILRHLGFVPMFRYEKFRAEWTDGKGEVVVDITPIGAVAEIEGPPEWIDATAKKLSVKPSQYITKSYAALFFEWKARTKSSAEYMTFAHCGTTPPPAS